MCVYSKRMATSGHCALMQQDAVRADNLAVVILISIALVVIVIVLVVVVVRHLQSMQRSQ
jgi:hypothetical protein